MTSRAINQQDVINLKTRVRLLFISLIFGATLGGWAGREWVNKNMTEGQAFWFPVYLQSRVFQEAGFGSATVISPERKTGDVVAFLSRHHPENPGTTAVQFLAWAVEKYPADTLILEAKTRQLLLYFPVGGALAGAGLLFALTKLLKKDNRSE